MTTLKVVPETATEFYTLDDIANVRTINEWLDENQHSLKYLADSISISRSQLSRILAFKYTAPCGDSISKILKFIEREEQRTLSEKASGFVETSVYRVMTAACRRAHLYRCLSAVSAFVGTGKTLAAREYAANTPGTILIEAIPGMTAGVLLSELVKKTDAIVHKSVQFGSGSLPQKMAAIIEALKGTDSLLILDEAETVSPKALEFMRRISDIAGVGLVFCGTERLKSLIGDPHGRFGQINSRVIFWPKVIESITRVDSDALVKAALASQSVKPSAESLDAFWAMGGGSARVLCHGLIPGIVDYGLQQGHSLTPDLVYKIGDDLLGFKRRRAPRGRS